MDELQKFIINKEQEDPIQKDSDTKCVNCESTDLDFDLSKGYCVCVQCGIINNKILDINAEWRYYSADDCKIDPSRCGCPSNPYLPKSSLGTMIASKNVNLTRIHQWNSMPYNERSLLNVFEDISSRCVKNNIPKSVIDDAIFYYKQIHDSKVITRGAIRKGLKAACVLIACQKKKISMVPNDIARIFEVKSTDITRGCKKFYELIGNMTILNDVENLTSHDYVQRFCKKIGLSSKFTEIAKQVAQNTEKLQITCENTPPSVAAGSILLVCTEFNLNIGKKKISDGCNISEVTITKTYRKMQPYQDDILPSKSVIQTIDDTKTYENTAKLKLHDLF